MTTEVENNIFKIKINNTDIFLEDFGDNKGKITVSDTYGYNYSMFWGAMGGSLKDFLCSINSEYFADKLMGSQSNNEMDVKKTFTELRKFIRTELDLPWYKHLEFQKDMREKMKDFQRACEDSDYAEHYFVDNFFSSFIDNLDFYLIEDKYERGSIESELKEITEQWSFIHNKPNRQYLWLMKLHKDLKKQLKK